ncbi:MAG: peptide/nickel transport system permease protein [Thermotogaceae bacterium]|nr:peptide/nickel transport system permease protein [Thermotogaceae bacterium]
MKIIKDLFKYDKRFSVGFIFVVLILFMAILSFFPPYDPTIPHTFPRDLSPSLKHILGTNSLGQDIFWILTIAVRNSLIIGGISAVISRTLAILIGSLAGYLGGRVDRVISTVCDSFVVIPRLPLLILFAFIFRGFLNPLSMAILLGFLDWAWPSKRYRSQILSLKESEFTNTARFSGAYTLEIIAEEHMPFLLSYVVADSISGFIWAIGMETSLSVLGLFDLSIPTLGTTIYWANYYKSMLLGIWWWIGSPVGALIITVIGLYLLSVGLGDFLDPKVRLQRLSK